MGTLEVILGRRSVRKYLQKEVSDEVINRILESARWAPSGGNKQPWRFVVVKDPIRRKLIKTISTGMRGEPPIIIVACMEKGSKAKEIEDTKYLDMGAAIQNILVAAHSLGVGTCWIVSTNWSGIKSALELTENSEIEPISLIALGYPNEDSLPKRKRRPIHDIAFLDTVKQKWEC